MASRKAQSTEPVVEKILTASLAEIVGDRFGKYAKYIIQERALPDVRDGLKPVQRRILYSMYVDGNIAGKPYRKSAKTVGAVMANYHPHGDSSIYDAMVRMSQNWKMLHPLIDMQGNNGSIDNDPPAAMRYTEARLAALSNELIKDIEKNTVDMAPNFDDTVLEPTVFPSNFPSVLVNGAKGIAAGYSTEIPPHNLKEIIDAVIMRIDNPYSTIDDVMKIMKGPDFPTGGIVQGKDGIKEAFSTGKGKIMIKSKAEIVEDKNMNYIVITEIPYEMIKSDIVLAIDDIRKNKKIDGIIEVRDETDRDGLRIVVDLKKEADAELVLNYLMKNGKLRVSYNYNMVVIKDKRPCLLGVLDIIDAFISHRYEVIERRAKYDLDKYNARLHIIDGLIIAIDVLDEVIKIIRASKDKNDSKLNLQNRFGLSEKQAEAIVSLQLYRLSSTDIIELKQEKAELTDLVNELTSLLKTPSKIRKQIAKELKFISDKYAQPRRSVIEEEVDTIEISKTDLVAKENVMVVVTRDGYFKRSSIKSYQASIESEPGYKKGDIIVGISEAYTLDVLLAFTNKGNYLYVPVYEIKETKWKDEGAHLSSLVSGLDGKEKIISTMLIKDFNINACIILSSKSGYIKRCLLKDFVMTRYSKTTKCMKLTSNEDELIGAVLSDGKNNVILTTSLGYVHIYSEDQIAISGLKSTGVITNKYAEVEGDLVNLFVARPDEKVSMFAVTQNGGYKCFSLAQVKVKNRSNAGVSVMKYFKSDPQLLVSSLLVDKDDVINLLCSDGEIKHFNGEDLKHQPIDKITKSNPNFGKNQSAVVLVNAKPKIFSSENIVDNPSLVAPVEVENDVVVNALDDFDIDKSFNLFNYDKKGKK
jgi:topoisomerase-4 subunit A